MAPEQILGQTSEICGATDLYALGCVLYRVLSGQAPFERNTERELESHCFEEPARLSPAPEVPEGVADLVMRLLLKRPWERATSAAEVRKEWAVFRPDAIPELQGDWGRSPSLSSSGESALNTEPELTRPSGPLLPKPPASRLRRSSRWLPGLLSVRPSPLVGRANLCALLAESCNEVVSSRTAVQRALILTGPAGIGKSRLADWLCTDVEERGLAISLRGHGNAFAESGDPLALALADRFNLRSAARTLPAALVDRYSRHDVSAIAEFIFASVTGQSAARPPEPRHDLAPILLHFLQDLAGQRPLVLWLDDISRLTSPTLAVLASLARAEPAPRVFVIATARPETLGQSAANDVVCLLLGAMRTEFLRVSPLDSLSTSAMLRAALPIDPALALQIALESGGVPLMALGKLHALARKGKV
jgi:eukaryotic-like serine/threonine-protein kinase